MTLATKFKQQLKAQAHSLKPYVSIGNNGLTEAVNKEIDRALNDHELIKIRIHLKERDVRKALFAEICDFHLAEAVNLIGNIAILYRKKVEK